MARDTVGALTAHIPRCPCPLQTPVMPLLPAPLWLALGLWGQDHEDFVLLSSRGPPLHTPRCPSNSQPLLCLYLKRLQESPMAPILKLVLFGAQSQHGLSVGMEFIMKVVQEGGPRPVLEGKRGVVKLALVAEACPLPGGIQTPGPRAAILINCIRATVWTYLLSGLHTHKCCS